MEVFFFHGEGPRTVPLLTEDGEFRLVEELEEVGVGHLDAVGAAGQASPDTLFGEFVYLSVRIGG